MPLYNYKCKSCGVEFEAFNTVSDREMSLHGCGGFGEKVLSPIARPVIMEYYSESLGGYVTGPRQKQRLMREKGVSEAA